MAGYMTKLQGYVYEGELVNGAAAPVENGILMVIGTDNKFVLPTADTTTVLLCVEADQIYDGFDLDTRTNVPAYRFKVMSLANPYYFVEQNFKVDPIIHAGAYDMAKFTVAVGELMRNHPLLPGEEFWTTKVTGTPVVGTTYGVKADGTIG